MKVRIQQQTFGCGSAGRCLGKRVGGSPTTAVGRESAPAVQLKGCPFFLFFSLF